MHTSFSAEQLADPSLVEAERIIRSCVRHGFCPQTCPTYVLLGDENDSPRGRIDLMRAMLERGGSPDAASVRHIDRCLSCLACETTCAARVDYRHLLDRARLHIEAHYRRPWRERRLRDLVAGVLPNPRRLRVALALGRLVRPFARLLPRSLAAMLALLPATSASTSAASGAGGVTSPPAVPQRRVALLAGCVQQVMGAHITAATARLLTRLGCEVLIVGDDACCGALSLHLGRDADARHRAQGLLERLGHEIDGAGLDAIVVDISGCGTTLKDYGHLFSGDPSWRDRAAQVAAMSRDVSEFVATLEFPRCDTLPNLPIAYHDACSLQHGQRITQPPRELLRKAGFDVREIPERHFCCGSAGVYNLLEADIAAQLGARKAQAVKATGACAVAAGNLGCMVQLGHHSGLPLVHTVELLDWASGGPRPAALTGLDLSAFPPRVQTLVVATGEVDEINYWVYEVAAAVLEAPR